MTTTEASPPASPATRLVDLLARLDEIEAERKTLESERELLEEQVLTEWLNTGVQRTTINGRTLYVERKLWADWSRDHKQEDIIAVLEEANLEDLVTRSTYPNKNSLGKWVREACPRDDLDLPVIPEELQPYIKTGTHHKLVARRST